jgi:hypothetical protein
MLLLVAVLVAVAGATGCSKPQDSGGSAASTATGAWKAGDKVDVNWNGSWWQGSVLSVDSGKYKVHYTGWSASWDETVDASRLRAPTGTAAKGTEAPN